MTKGRTEDDLLEATHAVFAGHLLAEMPPSKVAPNPEPNKEGYDPSSRTILANAAETLELHDDGHRAFGDCYPGPALPAVRTAGTLRRGVVPGRWRAVAGRHRG